MGKRALAQYHANKAAPRAYRRGPHDRPRKYKNLRGPRICGAIVFERRATRIVAALACGVDVDTIARDLHATRAEVIRLARAEGVI